MREHRLFESLECIGRRAIERHLDVGEQAETELRGVEPREVSVDIAGALEATHALERRRDGETDFSGEAGDRAPPVLLQACEQQPIDAVEFGAWIRHIGEARSGPT